MTDDINEVRHMAEIYLNNQREILAQREKKLAVAMEGGDQFQIENFALAVQYCVDDLERVENAFRIIGVID